MEHRHRGKKIPCQTKNSEKESAGQGNAEVSKETAWADAERYYEANSLPQFYIAFGELDEKEQEMWLDRIYADENYPFFSVSVKRLDVEVRWYRLLHGDSMRMTMLLFLHSGG